MKRSMMRRSVNLVLAVAWLGILAVQVSAAEFQWMSALNTQAAQDMTKFNQTLQDRFGLAQKKIQDILDKTGSAADAYMSLRLGEMSGKSVDDVVEKYQKGKQKGWGALAKSLGIKPGSREFHDLKAGHDLDSPDHDQDGKGKGAGKGNGKEKTKKEKKKK